MKHYYIIALLGSILLLSLGCGLPRTVEQSPSVARNVINPNPAAPGFRAAASDARAIALADSVMQAMGGRQAWDNTRYLHWTFFGRRTLLWDKWTGQVRIDFVDGDDVAIVNINDTTGLVRRNGEVLTQPDSLRKYLQQALSIWINDSYWLVMPYKLKDSGVALRYLGADTTAVGRAAEVVELTFEQVGDTPQNKYHVFIDPEDHRVTQWHFFVNADDPKPRFTTSWDDYDRYGNIWLASSRGTRQITDIQVLPDVPAAAFTAPEQWR